MRISLVRQVFTAGLVFAAIAGASAQQQPAGQQCGGFAGAMCGNAQEFCDFEAPRCGVGDQMGACVMKPEICTREFSPVCGCDGKTYANDCERRAAGVSKRADGEC